MDTVISVIGTAWLLAGIPVAAIAFLAFWGFLRHLPFTTRALFLIGGGLFITGALGVEAVGGRYLTNNGGIETLTYQMMVVVEEGLEMVGIVVFLYAVMTYMATHRITLLLALRNGQSPVEPFASLRRLNRSPSTTHGISSLRRGRS